MMNEVEPPKNALSMAIAENSTIVYLILYSIFQIYLITQAMIEPATIAKKVYGSEAEKFAEIAEAQNNIAITWVLAFLSIFILMTAVIKATKIKSRFMKTLLSISFMVTSTGAILFSNSNIVYMFFSLTFGPAMLYYILEYGELVTFIQNRIVVFTLRRLFAIVPMFLLIATFTFFAMNVLGDPVKAALGQTRTAREEKAKALKARWGLIYPPGHPKAGEDIPLLERYFIWLNNFIHGDLGVAFKPVVDVAENIDIRIWETLKMQLTSLLISFFISVIIGVLAAYYHKTVMDGIVSSIALIGLSMPIFVTGILAIIIFGGTGLNWFPGGKAHSETYKFASACTTNEFDCATTPQDFFGTYAAGNLDNPQFWSSWFNLFTSYTADSMIHLVLPVLTLAFATMATFARLTRGEMLEVMIQDYITAARANGLSEYVVVRKHAMKNVMLPLVTFLGLSFGGILAGAPITETVFSYPGLGNYFLSVLAIFDYTSVMAITMIITLMTLISNLIVDVVYTFLDPRISL